MGGLAIGSLIAANAGDRTRRPVRVYAALEATVAVSGIALVYALHSLTPALVPVLRLFANSAPTLDALRLSTAFVLLLLPATAMGATLPVLVRALSVAEPDYGRAVGLLYGANTLGAVAGSLLCEPVLVARLGVRGAAGTAALCDGLLALAALAIASRWRVALGVEHRSGAGHAGARARWMLAAAFLAGGLLLAMEVIWFRFLLLFVFGTSVAFAVMLATVLLGIGLGSLAAAIWLRFQPSAHEWLPVVAALAGLATVLTYAGFADLTRRHPGLMLYDLPAIASASGRLMLPTSVVSGALFSLMAKRLKEEMPGEARAAAFLTAANTVGAALGALGACFLLLPNLGVERSVLAVSCGYGAVGIALLFGRDPARILSLRRKATLALTGAVLGVVGALFPHGLMRNHYLVQAAGKWDDGTRILAVREGPAETLIYKRKALWGEAVFDRLIVNGFSMSSSHYASRRYMNLFVYLPVALHPAPRRALVICYGVGSTAKALTDTQELTDIDVVDTSRDILEMGRLIFPPSEGYPLEDPRVRVRVEDGRFFLLTTDRRYDLITGEPPPPKNAGVVNLYSREYFSLVRGRLTDGGMASYWLPVYQLELPETKAVIRAFCDVFEDCSLWTGFSYEWILMGTRHARGPVSEERFSRQWRDPVVAPTLRALGIEAPEQLGALFLADATSLRQLTDGVAPLDDDHPLRISPRFPTALDPFYPRFMDTGDTAGRFAASDYVATLWPTRMRAASLAAFWPQALINRLGAHGYGGPEPGLPDLAAMLTRTRLRTPVYWLLRSSAREQAIARHATDQGLKDPQLDRFLGIEAMADRDYVAAERHFRTAQSAAPDDQERIYGLRVLALCLAGRAAEAKALSAEAADALRLKDLEAWRWLSSSCGTPSSSRPD
jgi:spermidine synthase